MLLQALVCKSVYGINSLLRFVLFPVQATVYLVGACNGLLTIPPASALTHSVLFSDGTQLVP